jgi:hypothetical protein
MHALHNLYAKRKREPYSKPLRQQRQLTEDFPAAMA